MKPLTRIWQARADSRQAGRKDTFAALARRHRAMSSEETEKRATGMARCPILERDSPRLSPCSVLEVDSMHILYKLLYVERENSMMQYLTAQDIHHNGSPFSYQI